MPYTIEIKRTLSDQFFKDVMVTMVESGYHSIRYWGQVIDLDRDNDLNVTRIVVREGTDDEPVEDGAEATITAEVVANAIQSILRDAPVSDDIMGYIERAVRDEDAGDIDAIAADCIAQIAVLDRITYG